MIGLKPHLREVFDSASIPQLEQMIAFREWAILTWDEGNRYWSKINMRELDDAVTELEYLKAVLSHRRYEEQYGD